MADDAPAAAPTDGEAPSGQVAPRNGGERARWEADVVLADGGTVHIRPIRPDDGEAIVAFHERQSPDSIYFRYFTAMPKLTPRMLDNLLAVDHLDRLGLGAELGDGLIGMATYDTRPDRSSAEVAFMVDEEHQGRGLATVLLEYLVVAAREAGLGELTAMVLPSNRRMLSVFARAGFEQRRTFQDGVVEVMFDIGATEAATALVEERERRAAAGSVARLVEPRSIAVVGAGREPGGLGHELFRNLLAGGFEGPVYPVNPHGGHVGGVRAWPSVVDVPDDVDVAVLAVPAASTVDVIEQCARKRVRGLIVTSAGYAGRVVQVVGSTSPLEGEPADAGTNRGAVPLPDLLAAARRWGIRMIGPESLGAVNTAPKVSMVATFAPVEVAAGAAGFLSQSGTLGVAALDVARRKGVGISSFVDLGSKVDVSGNDILQYWEEDGRTRVGLLYLESFGNPRRFVRIARRVSRRLPLVAVKSGSVSPPRRPGEPADDLHWPADATYGALLAQCGVIRVDGLAQLFDVARVLLHQPVPTGRRVAVVSNSKGASSMTRDAVAGSRLTSADFAETTVAAVEDAAAGTTVTGGVVELPFDAGPRHYERALAAVQDDEGIDAVLVVYAPAIGDRRAEVGRAIGAVVDGRRTVLATFLGAPTDAPLVSGSVQIPLFELPGEAIATLAHVAAYGEWLSRPLGDVPDGPPADVDLEAARRLVGEVLAEPGGASGRWLEAGEVARLCDAFGLPLAPSRSVTGVDDAVAAAETLGYPVVVKAGGIATYYRGEDGGVALDLRSAEDVRAAVNRMADRLGDAMATTVVQRMVHGGVDALVGVHQHPAVGGVLTVGLGGIAALGQTERAVGVLPLSDEAARRLVLESPLSAALEVADPAGGAARQLTSLVERLSAVSDAVPEVADLVANPVIISGGDLSLTDVRVRVAPAMVDLGPDVRRL
ncbi:MAG: GNAT family N-acetyltransferase [Acidimicrobiia bacterium]|nr:GNAT family N-acetyltransferase [Acidimicrobiia bacterium]